MKVYKIGDYRDIGVAVIYISREVTDQEHEKINELSEKMDLAFVFPKGRGKVVSGKKFSHLYGAVFYSLAETDDEALEIWGMIDYIHELTKYYSYSIILQEDLPKIDVSVLENVKNSIIENSIYSWRKLKNEEVKKIYTTPELTGWRKYLPTEENSLGMYSRYKTEDPVMFVRPVSIQALKEDLRKMGPEVLATFKGSGIKTLLPSLIPLSTNTNLEVRHANYNTVREKSRLS